MLLLNQSTYLTTSFLHQQSNKLLLQISNLQLPSLMIWKNEIKRSMNQFRLGNLSSNEKQYLDMKSPQTAPMTVIAIECVDCWIQLDEYFEHQIQSTKQPNFNMRWKEACMKVVSRSCIARLHNTRAEFQSARKQANPKHVYRKPNQFNYHFSWHYPQTNQVWQQGDHFSLHASVHAPTCAHQSCIWC